MPEPQRDTALPERARTVTTKNGHQLHAVRARRYYDVRDRLGHYVKPASAELAACPHKCCQGKRPHPEKLPVVFDKAVLRSRSEPELLRELEQYSNFTESHPVAFGQIVAEFDRRDRAEKRAQRKKERYRAKSDEYRDEVYRQVLAAEAATNGYMVNKAGRAAGIEPITLFTGPEARVRKWASPELIEYFEQHDRPVRARFFGGTRGRRDYYAASRL